MTHQNQKLTFLYTNIGRGHPFYLDGIIEEMVKSGSIGKVKNQTDVFETSSGLSKLAWIAVRFLYRKGSQDGLVKNLYASIRRDNNYNNPGLLQNILSSSIKSKFSDSDFPLIVAHPILVAALKKRKNLFMGFNWMHINLS